MVLTMSVATLVLVPRLSKPLGVADIGTVAPDFELTDIHGGLVSLSDYHGQSLVLFFSSLHSTGGFACGATPVESGPRHWGQFAAFV